MNRFRSSQIKIVILLQADPHKNDHFLINHSFHFHNTYKFIWKFSKKSSKFQVLNSLVNIFDEILMKTIPFLINIQGKT